ncbi:interferon regulatory factor 1 isoform X2 [Hemicordylus capensis]|uniref:interferon regulatory factor 1 isoform X2 n=1 Tax=Hemicordylus capensis TaxID=884348 RepID=UPI002302D77C|nr:interferon regulatory factor 1 isoform X2 [Hemicordylus capensis]
MPQPRMRMRPWLELQINSNEIPGLIWINKEEKLFQIPWKHAAKHGWELERDACLFRNWAIHTGRYKKGEVLPDPKTWKANFRCAMNSLPDIEEVKDRSISKGSSAIRVYRMLPASAKSQKKEKKSKSLKIKNVRKSVEDIKTEETAEATNSIQLPDDHSGYILPSYQPEEMEAESTSITLELSSCDMNNTLTDWRRPLDIQLPDSTNDMYPLQVSPPTSSSDGTDEDDDKFNHFYQLLNSSDWHQTNVGGKGFLSNEPGTQNLYFDFCFQEQDAAADTSSETIQNDSKNSLEFSLLESLRMTNLHPISCGM